MLALFHQIENFVVQLWDLQIQILLMLQRVAFKTLFNLSEQISKAGDFFNSILDGILFFLLNLDLKVHQSLVKLLVQVNLISLWLEIILDSGIVFILKDEVRHI